MFYGGDFSSFSILYDLFGRIIAMFSLNYLVVSFILKSLHVSFVAWKSMYFLGHVLVLVPLLLLDTFQLKEICKKYHGKNVSEKQK
jgi:hypothetical protein